MGVVRVALAELVRQMETMGGLAEPVVPACYVLSVAQARWYLHEMALDGGMEFIEAAMAAGQHTYVLDLPGGSEMIVTDWLERKIEDEVVVLPRFSGPLIW